MNYEEIYLNSGGVLWAVDLEHRFTAANKNFSHLVGAHDPHNIQGKKHAELPCKISEDHKHFTNQDRLVFAGKQVITIETNYYVNNQLRSFLSNKEPLRNHMLQITGLTGSAIELKQAEIKQFIRQLIESNKYYTGRKHQLNTSFTLLDKLSNKLTERESECLFYLIRGHSAKLTAQYLKISPKTVEFHISRLKTKLDSTTKHQLIEQALEAGYFYYIPKSLINQHTLTTQRISVTVA